jgi:phenylpropionate dioxygenase-like ring-hydroxylating dioxygenase large terminal subunit
MNVQSTPTPDTVQAHDNFIPREHYVSPEIAKLEHTRLWQRVWQVACREEDVPEVGNHFTYDILDQSIVIVRSAPDTIKAYHNSCPHRGRRLTNGCGSGSKLFCRFHGWQWNLDGKNLRVQDREDWDVESGLNDADIALSEVRVGTWGGFVFICMDPDAEHFETFIQPVPRFLDCLEFDKMRYSWIKTMPMKANWKTAMEAFMESYHVAFTHPQLLPHADETNHGQAQGKHGQHIYHYPRPMGAPAVRTGRPVPDDLRPGFAAAMEFLVEQTAARNRDGNISARAAKAAQRVLTEVPDGASHLEVQMKGAQFMAEAAIAEGAGWPNVTAEQIADMGVDWNIFPNLVFVFGMDSTLVFRAIPDGDDPNRCIFQMSTITRYAPGKQPEVTPEFYADWRQHVDDIPPLLLQDVKNMEEVQAGMNSMGYKGSRLNPVQEVQIANHHRVLREYLDRP